MRSTLNTRIVIVDVDERSLAEIVRWPWSRDHMAVLADEMFARQRVAVVGFDMLFAEPDTSSGLPAERWLLRDYNAMNSVLQLLGTRQLAIPVDARAQARVSHRGPGGPRGGAMAVCRRSPTGPAASRSCRSCWWPAC